MVRYIKLFLWVLTISFFGSLPIGTLNVTVASLFVNRGFAEAGLFAGGAILVEVFLVRVAIVGIKKLEGLNHLHKFFNALTCVVLFLFAWLSFRAALQTQKFVPPLPFTAQNPVFTGAVVSLLNPLHLPFWLGWTAILRSRKIFWDSASARNVYVTAIGLGTSMAFFIYGILGALLINFLKEQQSILNWIMGFALLGTGMLQGFKYFGKAAPTGKDNKNEIPATA